MTVRVIFLRGINVGGANIIKMDELKDILKALGLEDVKTYIQSGNIVCRCKKKNASALAKDISKAIEEEKGFAPHAYVLSLQELEKVANDNPFKAGESDSKSLHLSFLDSAPANPDLKSLGAIKSKTEQFKLVRNVFYLYAPDGIGRSKLAGQVEKLLGVSATGRNWRTVTKMIELANEL